MTHWPPERYSSWLVKNSIAHSSLARASASSPRSPARSADDKFVQMIIREHCRNFSAAPPPPTDTAAQESYLNGSSASYVEDMYDSWAHDPSSVHPSWDSYFRNGSYQVNKSSRTNKTV